MKKDRTLSRPVGALRFCWRWLLQLDHPVPARSKQEIEAEAERNYRWNLTANLLDGSWFFFGMSFASATTILPLFISKLTSSPYALGVLAVVARSGWFLPQLFTSNAVEQMARKKPVALYLGFLLEGLPMWGLFLAAIIAARSPVWALAIFALGYTWHVFGSGVVATAYQDLLARCFPVQRRGRSMGIANVLGFGAGALGSVVSAWVLETRTFPENFVILFAIAAAAVSISFFFLGLTREPVEPVTVPEQNSRQFWAGLPQILRQDRNFRHFLIARLLMVVGGMGTGFVAVGAMGRWHVADGTMGLYTGALLVGEVLGSLPMGLLADRFGHKLSLEFSILATALAFALAWLAPGAGWYYLVFLLLGIGAGALRVSGTTVVMEFCGTGRRPTYIGLANTGVGAAEMVAPLVGAWLAGIDYGWLFALSAALSLTSLAVMRWWVQEPRRVAGLQSEVHIGG